MSYNVSSACEHLHCPGVAKNVLMALADMANDDGYCWPGIDRICRRVDWGRSSVIEALAWLEEMRAIQRDRSNGRGTTYWVTPDDYTGERHPPVPKRSGKRTSPPAGPVRQPDTQSPPAGPNQSASRTLSPRTPAEHKSPQPPKGGAFDGWRELCRAYPAHRLNRHTARKYWKAINPDEALQRLMVEAAKVQARSPLWQAEHGKAVPNLSGWLLNECWLQTHDPEAPAAQTAVTRDQGAPAAEAFTDDQLTRNKARASEAAALARRNLAERRLQGKAA